MIEQSEKNLVQIKILNSFLPAISREDLTAVGGKAHEVDSRSIGPPTKSAGVTTMPGNLYQAFFTDFWASSTNVSGGFLCLEIKILEFRGEILEIRGNSLSLGEISSI